MKKIALTLGEPAGIGPDIFIKLAQQECLKDIVVIADPNVLMDRAKQLNLKLNSKKYIIHEVPLIKKIQAGQPNIENASMILAALDRAISGCLDDEFAALVTGPIDKSIINQAGKNFSGHTEYLAEKTHSLKTIMCFQNADMRMALMSTHIALRDVPNYITEKRLIETLKLLQQELVKKFHLTNPKIAVCGLNPHAGERGYLGREEIEVIEPAIQKLQQQGLDCHGPYPADTVFMQSQFDCIVSMYHDQLLPAMKYKNFFDTVNITLGLPFVRTSVDHGTAYGLAGTGKASSDNLKAAINAARAMVNS